MTDTPDNPFKPLVVGMTKAEAILDTGPDSLYALIRAGELDSYLEGKRRKITMQSIERLIEKRLAAASGEFLHSERMRVLRVKSRVAADRGHQLPQAATTTPKRKEKG